jgi:hypothetical protein
LIAGSHHAGARGVQHFVETHAHAVGTARFLNIEGVGAGEISATIDEGVLRERRTDRYLWSAAEDAGAETRSYRGFHTGATPLLARKFRASSLLGLTEEDLIARGHPREENLERALTVASSVVAVAVEPVDAR